MSMWVIAVVLAVLAVRMADMLFARFRVVRKVEPVIIPPKVKCPPADKALEVKGQIVNVRWGLTT